jgi:transposase-like protein
MAHPPELRAKVRASYVHDRLPLETAAEKHGIGYATARRWKSEAENDGDDWERARSAARLSGDGIRNVAQLMLEDYLTLHQATVDAVKSADNIGPLAKAEVLSRLADAFTKTMSAVGKASPELSRLAIATDVIQRLAEYTEADFPQHIAAIVEIIEPFAAELAKEFG